MKFNSRQHEILLRKVLYIHTRECSAYATPVEILRLQQLGCDFKRADIDRAYAEKERGRCRAGWVYFFAPDKIVDRAKINSRIMRAKYWWA